MGSLGQAEVEERGPVWVDGWVGGWKEEEEGWVGGWVGGWGYLVRGLRAGGGWRRRRKE